MTVMRLIFLSVLVIWLPSCITAHSYMTKPSSRFESVAQSGCRGPSCTGPCDAPKTRLGVIHQAKRGDLISVEWPRNNHPGGFVRYAWTTFDQSGSHKAFDLGVQAYSCYETGPGCRSATKFLNGGDNNPQDGSVNPCKLRLGIPLHLPNGRVTLQWAWFGGTSNPSILGDYYSCADYEITGGPTGPYLQPVFYGGDVSHPDKDVCKFGVTRQLRVCVNQPCLNGPFPNSGNEVGIPIPTSSDEVAWVSAKTGLTTREGGKQPVGSNPAPTPAPLPAPTPAPAPTPSPGSGPIRTDGRCGPGFADAPCKPGECCSRFSFCGTGRDYCGSGGNPTPQPTPAPTPAPATPVYFLEDIWPIIQARGGVHVSAPDGWTLLRMPDPETAYANLINKPSVGQPSKVYVKPGDPDNSYIILKLTNGVGVSGQQMPLGGPYLSMQQINHFRNWILQGARFAKNNSPPKPSPTQAPPPKPLPTQAPPTPSPTQPPPPGPPSGNVCSGIASGLACDPGDCSCNFHICKDGASAGKLRVALGTICVGNAIAPGSDSRCQNVKC